MSTTTSVDLLIVGAGPVGLFGAYYAGVRGLRTAVVDSLSQVGGQVSAMYPEKQIFDIAGFPAVSGRQLIANLVEQAAPYEPVYLLGQEAQELERTTDEQGRERLVVTTSTGDRVEAGAVVVTGGIGTFSPRPLPAGEDFLGRGLEYFVPSSAEYAGQDVVVVGGGDSAVDWANMLHPIAKTVTLVHRRDAFRAHHGSVEQMQAAPVEIVLNAQVTETVGGSALESVTVTPKGRSPAPFPAPGSSPRSGSPPTSARCASGASSSTTTGTSSSTRRCAPTSPASSPPATSLTTTARCASSPSASARWRRRSTTPPCTSTRRPSSSPGTPPTTSPRSRSPPERNSHAVRHRRTLPGRHGHLVHRGVPRRLHLRGERKLYINPKECIDCGACEPVCPVEAISQDRRVADDMKDHIEDNRRFFTEPLEGRDEPLGAPGGSHKTGPIGVDTPMVQDL